MLGSVGLNTRPSPSFEFSLVALSAQTPLLQIETVIDLGEDRGQNFGSLFEARDNKGRVVLGAGFVGVYNTMFRGDRQTVQFFIRPADDRVQFTSKTLPRSTRDGGTYLFGLDLVLREPIEL